MLSILPSVGASSTRTVVAIAGPNLIASGHCILARDSASGPGGPSQLAPVVSNGGLLQCELPIAATLFPALPPLHAPARASLRLQLFEGQQSNPTPFLFIPSLSLASIRPPLGPIHGGYLVQLSGSNPLLFT